MSLGSTPRWGTVECRGIQRQETSIADTARHAPRAPTWDPREWLRAVDAAGELRQVGALGPGADLGSLALAAVDLDPGVCLTGHLGGTRFVLNAFGSPKRIGLALGLSLDAAHQDGVEELWRRAVRGVTAREPHERAPGFGEARVDLRELPRLGWPPGAEGDLGAGVLALIGQPSGDPLVAPARAAVIDRDRASVRLALPPLPAGAAVAVVLGADPLLALPAAVPGLTAESPYWWVGGVRGGAAEVYRSPESDLLLPAAEVVLEGRVEPGRDVVRITSVRRRADAVIFGDVLDRRPNDAALFAAYAASALLERRLHAAGLARLAGVWLPPEGGTRQMTVIGIRQSSGDHAARALRLAAEAARSTGGQRVLVVVDHDIDIHSLDDVLWALLTRCDPARDMTVVGGSPDGETLLVDGTKPWAWLERFAESISSPAAEAAARERWRWILEPGAPDPRAVADG